MASGSPRSLGGRKTSQLGAWEGAVRRARRSLGEGRRRMGKVGGVERSPQIPCMVHFRPRTGAKTGAGHRVRPGEEYVDGETILDVLRRRNARAEEVPKYVDPLAYNDLGYVSNHS